jgi:hypothetical protein
MQFATTLRNSLLSAISTAVGAGGTIVFYTGTSPGVGSAVTGTLLSTLTAVTLAAPSGGTMTMSATADSSAAASGTPGYGRIRTSGAAAVIDCTAAVGSGEFNFSGAISLGGTVTLSSGTFTAGNP